MIRKWFYIFIFLTEFVSAQSGLFINGLDASLKIDSSSFLSIDGDFYNMKCNPISKVRFNGTLYLSGSFINNDSLKFSATSGTGNSKRARIVFKAGAYTPTISPGPIIGGTVVPIFWEVEVDRGLGLSLYLANNVKCLDTLTFKSGRLYINGYKWNLIDPSGTPNVINHPYIKNERNISQFTAANFNDTGQVIYQTIYSQSLNINPANIGIEISGFLNIGSPLKIMRGFNVQVNAVKQSIQRYFDIYSPGHSLTNNSIKMRYTYNDMGAFPLSTFDFNALSFYASPNTDMNWSELPSVHQNTITRVIGSVFDGEMTVQVSDLNLPNINLAGEGFRITIADPNCLNPPVSALLLDTVRICVGDTLVLDAGNNSSVSNSSLKWEWQTSPILYSRTLKVTPNSAYQKYNVALKDVKGCITKDSVIIAPAAPFPQITYLNHLNACFGDSIFIKDTVKISSGTYSNVWSFSDSSIEATNAQSFKKMFLSTGTHAFQLISTSNHGCSVTATSTNAIVYPLPTAAFTSSLNCNNHTTTFSNTSITNYSTMVISSSVWNLGLGTLNTSTLFSPSQSYTASGIYSVQLKVSTNFGCTDSILTPIQIYPLNHVQFIKNNVCLYDTAYFINTSACNTGSCNSTWSFGDGNSNITSSTKHVYANPGMYQVKLKINVPVGCPDSTSVNVFVNPKPLVQFNSSTNTVCVNESVYFSNTSSISNGSISSYVWNFDNSNSATTINSNTSYSIYGLFHPTLTAVSDSGCVNIFASPIYVPMRPIAQFSVSPVCSGLASQFVSSSSGNNLIYTWDYGNSILSPSTSIVSQTYTYPSAGNYTAQLIVHDFWNCSDTSRSNAVVLPSPSISLSGTIATCGTSYILDGGNPGAFYYWQPGNQSSQTISAQTSGLYQVLVSQSNACVSTQTVQLILNNSVKPNLGNDTIVCGPFKLDAGYVGSTYVWNTSASTQTLMANSSGSFVVQVTDQNNCSGSDTININVLSPALIDLGTNLTMCKPKYGYIITPTTNAQSFLWSNGLSIPTIKIVSSGLYWCEVNLTNGCKNRDSLFINFLTTPQVELGNDSSACNAILLDAKNNNCTYLWNDGSSSQFLNASTDSRYWVVVTNSVSNCSQQDSINLIIHPNINLFLGKDTVVCNNIGFNLNAGNPNALYYWTTGATNQSIPISSSGIYGATVTSVFGCRATDYIQITVVDAPQIELGEAIKYICGESSIELALPNQTTVNWNSNTGLSSNSNSISTNYEGKYWATVNEYGCSASDTVLLIKTTNAIQASFLASTIDTINKPVQFVNLSSPAPTSQTWYFGDGTSSTELNPQHTFVLPQNYSVTLEVSNGYCTDKLTKELKAMFREGAIEKTTIVHKLEILNFSVYPNPTSNYLQINLELNDFAIVSASLFDLCGRQIKKTEKEELSLFTEYFDLNAIANGAYTLIVSADSKKGNFQKYMKIIKVE